NIRRVLAMTAGSASAISTGPRGCQNEMGKIMSAAAQQTSSSARIAGLRPGGFRFNLRPRRHVAGATLRAGQLQIVVSVAVLNACAAPQAGPRRRVGAPALD